MSNKPKVRRLTPEEYVKKCIYIVKRMREFHALQQSRIDELNAEYVRLYSDKQAGQTMELPEGTKAGYDKFLIEKVLPVISDHANGAQGAFHITFDYQGVFMNDTMGEEVRGTLRSPRPQVDTSESEATKN